jgi:tetratricopeptide (TPR) repeat protein
VASLYGVRREFNRAVPPLERALALCRDLFRGPATAVTASLLGHTYALSGRVADGLSLLEQALQAIVPTGAGTWHSLTVMNLAEGYAHADRLEDARAFAEQALALTRERDQRGWQARAFRLLGEIASHPDALDPETAQRHYRQALALASELEMRPLLAHCHLGLGKLYRRTGDDAKAAEHLTTARAMYREMGMGFWLAQAEAAGGAGGEP